MSRKYRKVILTLIVRADATEEVKKDVKETADLISTENFVYDYFITDHPCRRPANASDYDMDDGDGET